MRPFRKWTPWDRDVALMVAVMVGGMAVLILGHTVGPWILEHAPAWTLLAVCGGLVYLIWRLGADQSQ